jgi:hypothetical protein
MDTIKELENWIEKKGIKNTYTPKHRYVTDEDLGLEEINGIFIWYYIERGVRTDLEFFKNEKDAVQFVYEYLIKNER